MNYQRGEYPINSFLCVHYSSDSDVYSVLGCDVDVRSSIDITFSVDVRSKIVMSKLAIRKLLKCVKKEGKIVELDSDIGIVYVLEL